MVAEAVPAAILRGGACVIAAAILVHAFVRPMRADPRRAGGYAAIDARVTAEVTAVAVDVAARRVNTRDQGRRRYRKARRAAHCSTTDAPPNSAMPIARRDR